ncbi:sensor histidine kinase [Tardiphaga sp. vice154]|uniref:sensor histidine kinase n=1 Tax=Tardiphaga sp. vice154 TaxID=2592814 RepID=UPI001165517E|nr:ATP-binding protein [Tardiphaga sp. vice154]MBC7580869.1 sensor histidine kinase [Tardiphaga sp.]QDM23142.1 sensor histidine kinase [Tardiphaga sp. vice154]
MIGLKSIFGSRWAAPIRRRAARLTLFQQFTIAATVVLGFMMIAVGTWISARIVDGVLRSSSDSAALYLEGFLEPHIQSLQFGTSLPPESLAKLEEISASLALRRHVLSIKVWLPDGTIAFSSQKDLIGKKFDPTKIRPGFRGEIRGNFADNDDEENEFERKLGLSLYEIYAPLHKSGTDQIIAVGEFYENAERLHKEIFAAVQDWLVIGAAAIGMLLTLFAIVHRGSAIIDQQKRALKLRLREQSRLHHINDLLKEKMQKAMRESNRIDRTIQKRIGSQLHDGPAQLLSFVLLRLSEIGTALKAPRDANENSSNLIDEVRGAASDALADLRSISSGLLLPYIEDNEDIVGVLQSIISRHERHTGSRVDFKAVNVPKRLSRDIIHCVGGITQEALTNAHKHGGGDAQDVSLNVDDAELHLSIRDSGPGIDFSKIADVAAARNDRLGLLGMKYRVESVGGTLELKSAPSEGTEVKCKIPLNNIEPKYQGADALIELNRR